jgi:cytoskeletal protein CcmA (bactofilin family)
MTNHPFRFYLEADKTTAYTTDVTSTSTYTEIIVTDTTPTVLHYQCSSHSLMGNSVQTNSNTIVVSAASTFSGAVDINAALDVDGHTELDDVNVSGASTFTGAADFNGAVDIDGHLEVDDVNVSGASTFTGAADFNGAVDIDGHTELDDVNVSGASTFTGAADFNGAVDIDGHTELDDVNIAGFSTFVSNIIVGTGATVGFGSTAYFRDNAKAVFGDGEDLKIYHDGSNSRVDNSTGSIIIKNLANDQDVILATDDSSGGTTTYVRCDGSTGQVDLTHYGTTKLNTTGYGVTVSGGAFVSGISTFVGFATFSDYVFVQDGLNVAGVVTATSFDGLGQIGVGSEGTFIGVGITMVDFKSSNASNTVEVNGTSGIATVTVTTGVSIGLAIALGG